MQVSRGIEGSVEVGIEDLVYDSWGIKKAIKQQRVRFRTEAQSIQKVSRSYQGCKSFLDRSTRYREGVEIAFKKKCLRSLTDSKVSRRCRGGVKLAFKTSFLRNEKHRYECNPTYNSTNDPINTKISQNSLLIQKKNFEHKDLQNTHTHTKQV